MEDIIYTKNPMETQKFFDFEFQVLDGQVLDCYFQGGGEKIKLEPCIGQGLFLIKQKYDNKNKELKISRRHRKNLSKMYEIEKSNRKETREHLQKHIAKSESKLTEYKNTILAFGKLASCNSISK